MKAVILAGGLGTRLRPLTHSIPKPLVPVNGRPYLEYQIEYLKKFGITDIVLSVGHLGEKIESHFKDGRDFGVNIAYAREKEPLGTGGAIKNAEDKILPANEFLLLYGDSFLPIDVPSVVSKFFEHKKHCLTVVYNNEENTNVKNNIKLDEKNYVCAYDKENAGDSFFYVDSGVLCLAKDVLDEIPKDSNISLEFDIFPKLIENGNMVGYVTKTRFYDIGTPERLKEAEQFFQSYAKGE